MRKFLIMMLAAGLLAAGCGGDDDDSGSAEPDNAVAAAIAAEIMSEPDSPFSDEAAANCIANKTVEGIGVERLAELGVNESTAGSIEEIDFSDDEIATVVDAMDDCIDLTAVLATEFEADFGEEGAQCVADNLDTDLIKDLMAAGLAGDESEPPDEFFQVFLDIAAECDLPLN